MIDKDKVLEIIKAHFSNEHYRLKLRPQDHQHILGNVLTVLEIEIKKEIKSL